MNCDKMDFEYIVSSNRCFICNKSCIKDFYSFDLICPNYKYIEPICNFKISHNKINYEFLVKDFLNKPAYFIRVFKTNFYLSNRPVLFKKRSILINQEFPKFKDNSNIFTYVDDMYKNAILLL